MSHIKDPRTPIMELPCSEYTRREADYQAEILRLNQLRKPNPFFTTEYVCSRLVTAEGTPIYRITAQDFWPGRTS